MILYNQLKNLSNANESKKLYISLMITLTSSYVKNLQRAVEQLYWKITYRKENETIITQQILVLQIIGNKIITSK